LNDWQAAMLHFDILMDVGHASRFERILFRLAGHFAPRS